MKHIDEAQLLLAVGEVGDDLLLRSERCPTSSARQHWHQWGALAACFCLVLVLAAALQLPDMLRMGSNSSGAPAEPSMSESANAKDDAGERVDSAAPGDMDGVQYGNTTGQEPQDSAGSASEKFEMALDGADCLVKLGITGAADIADFFTTQKTADGDETARANRAQQFYDALAAATVISAEEDEQTFLPAVEGTLALASGDSLTFLYDPAHSALELGAYHFYNQDFSFLLGGA